MLLRVPELPWGRADEGGRRERRSLIMLEFSAFDRRHYPTISVRDGYREWRPSYEQTVEDEMDLALLGALESVPWTAIARAADLGCGTGRTGAWLSTRGVPRIDEVTHRCDDCGEITSRVRVAPHSWQ